MSNGRRSAWPSVLAWIAIVTTAGTLGLIAISLIGNFTGPIEWWKAYVDNTRQLYLLSATAQVLAALFALVFSITLIAVQFVTKYTHRTMRMIFNKKILWYMGGFALAVILPLWFISHPTGWGSLVCLFIGSVYVLSLVGFFSYLHKKLSIDGIIEDLKNEGLAAVENKEFKKTEESIKALDNIGMGAYTDKNYEVFELAEAALTAFTIKLEETAKSPEFLTQKGEIDLGKKPYIIHKVVFEKLRDTCIEVLDNPRAPFIILEKVNHMGNKALSKNLRLTTDAVALLFFNIENECAKSADKDLTLHRSRIIKTCTYCLHEMTKKSFDNQKNKIIEPWLTALIQPETSIYKKHLSNKQEDLIVGDHSQAYELIRMLLGYPEAFERVRELYFGYLDFYISRNLKQSAKEFCLEIQSFVFLVDKNGMSSELATFLTEKLQEYGNLLVDKEDEEWREVGSELFATIVILGGLAIEHHQDYTLSQTTHYAYLPAMSSKPLSLESLNKMIPWLLKQFIELLEADPEAFNESWITSIIEAVTRGLSILKKEHEVHSFSPEITSIGERLIVRGLREKWYPILQSFYNLLLEIIGGVGKGKVVLPFMGLPEVLWLNLAALLTDKDLFLKYKGEALNKSAPPLTLGTTSIIEKIIPNLGYTAIHPPSIITPSRPQEQKSTPEKEIGAFAKLATILNSKPETAKKFLEFYGKAREKAEKLRIMDLLVEGNRHFLEQAKDIFETELQALQKTSNP